MGPLTEDRRCVRPLSFRFVWWRSAWACCWRFAIPARPESTEKAKADIKELQQKRLAVLEQLCDVAKKLFSQARVEFTEVLAARRRLLADAPRQRADTRQDRIKACDEAIEEARQWQAITEARFRDARAPQKLPCFRPRPSSWKLKLRGRKSRLASNAACRDCGSTPSATDGERLLLQAGRKALRIFGLDRGFDPLFAMCRIGMGAEEFGRGTPFARLAQDLHDVEHRVGIEASL